MSPGALTIAYIGPIAGRSVPRSVQCEPEDWRCVLPDAAYLATGFRQESVFLAVVPSQLKALGHGTSRLSRCLKRCSDLLGAGPLVHRIQDVLEHLRHTLSGSRLVLSSMGTINSPAVGSAGR